MIYQIFTGLNAKGRAAMTEFLAENLNDQTLLARQEHFEVDVDFDLDPGAYELSGRYTKTGSPITTRFTDDQMDSEPVQG
jgi:hypothetical protein